MDTAIRTVTREKLQLSKAPAAELAAAALEASSKLDSNAAFVVVAVAPANIAAAEEAIAAALAAA